MDNLPVNTVNSAAAMDSSVFKIALSPTKNIIPKNKVGSPALYNASVSGYAHQMIIKHTTSFCMKPYKISAGPLFGCYALILIPNGSFRLMDLPRGVRNIIYSYVCVWPEPIKLKTYDFTSQNKHCRLVQTSFRASNNISSRSGHWDSEKKKYRDGDVNAASIHLVSKILHKEAAEILYSGNTFVVYDKATLQFLLGRAGSSCVHIRHLRLMEGYPVLHPLAFEPLQHAKGLRKLEIDPRDFLCSASLTNASLKRFIKACIPLLVILAVYWKRAKRNGSVLDVLQCMPCDDVVCNIWREENDLPGAPPIKKAGKQARCDVCGRNQPRFSRKDGRFFEKSVKKMLAMEMGIE